MIGTGKNGFLALARAAALCVLIALCAEALHGQSAATTVARPSKTATGTADQEHPPATPAAAEHRLLVRFSASSPMLMHTLVITVSAEGAKKTNSIRRERKIDDRTIDRPETIDVSELVRGDDGSALRVCIEGHDAFRRSNRVDLRRVPSHRDGAAIVHEITLPIPPQAKIIGRILGPDGPVADAEIIPYELSAGVAEARRIDAFDRRSGADGAFTLNVIDPPSRMLLVIDHHALTPNAKMVVLGGESVADLGTIRLAPAGALHGRVHSGGQDVAGSAMDWRIVPEASTARTDAEDRTPESTPAVASHEVRLGNGLICDRRTSTVLRTNGVVFYESNGSFGIEGLPAGRIRIGMHVLESSNEFTPLGSSFGEELFGAARIATEREVLIPSPPIDVDLGLSGVVLHVTGPAKAESVFVRLRSAKGREPFVASRLGSDDWITVAAGEAYDVIVVAIGCADQTLRVTAAKAGSFVRLPVTLEATAAQRLAVTFDPPLSGRRSVGVSLAAIRTSRDLSPAELRPFLLQCADDLGRTFRSEGRFFPPGLYRVTIDPSARSRTAHGVEAREADDFAGDDFAPIAREVEILPAGETLLRVAPLLGGRVLLRAHTAAGWGLPAKVLILNPDGTPLADTVFSVRGRSGPENLSRALSECLSPFTRDPLPPGRYPFTFTLSGYRPVTRILDITASHLAEVDVTMEPAR